MISYLRLWFRNPVFLLALAAGLIAFVVQSGEVGSADTMHRLQSTHAFWTSQPPVFPNEFPEFGVHGRGGRLQSWYGIGQSLLMLPQDILGTYISDLAVFDNYGDTDPTVRDIVVTYLTNILIAVLTALVCFRLLRQFGFSISQSVAGVLALLLATTHLHYTQNMMENNYIFLLTLTGFSFQYEWLRTGSRRALFYGSAAFGLNLLTRLTTGMDLLAGMLFVLLVLWFEGVRGRALWQRCRAYVVGSFPVFCFFGLLDRLYQFYRFGSFTNTYVSVVAKETLARQPNLPHNYPWTTPFHVGFWARSSLRRSRSSSSILCSFSPSCSSCSTGAEFRLTFALMESSASLMLLAYLSFYARYFAWARRLRMGRSLRFFSRGIRRADRVPAASALPSRIRQDRLGCRNPSALHQHHDSGRLPRLLAAARDLPDGNVRPSHLCDRPAHQKHCRLRHRQHGRVGA